VRGMGRFEESEEGHCTVDCAEEAGGGDGGDGGVVSPDQPDPQILVFQRRESSLSRNGGCSPR